MFKKSLGLVCLIILISTITFADTVDTLGNMVLKPGMESQDVGFIKLSMMVLGYYDTTALTLAYDDQLLQAVKAYQKDRGLDSDGVLGKNSFSAIGKDSGLPVIERRVLKPDEKDKSVKVLKVALRSLNYLLSPVTDDVFDSATFEAVKAFQVAQKLDSDGIAGLATINRLVELKRVFFAPLEVSIGTISALKLEKGMVSDEVIILQKALAFEGVFASTEFSTNFGDLTVAAVSIFQTKYGLIVDGVAGTGTLLKLEELGYIKKGVVPPVVTRGVRDSKFGEYISWNDASALLKRMSTIVTVEDFETGKTFKVKISYGHLHADVEALTAEDAKMVKAIWGGQWTWERRAVLVYYKDRVLAASMNAMPHAGLDASPEGKKVKGRSGGFGSGYNYDSIKGNMMDGHICMHFKDSKGHGSGKVDSKHQVLIKKAAGIK